MCNSRLAMNIVHVGHQSGFPDPHPPLEPTCAQA
ncbi:hypothetical protein OCA8868_01857 [Octadecabacter ascidiaceicola]|uniref:Uncharacterized protein n=1 Tax=Octadecabacter ascidiaceicola TaxID=1655543 RepID=A0A238K9J5_9RHOB|nr:hypothetical protein OCA8868_01857 [Octadecabacter ascidiaceicola]